jgi:hypothetical protein
MSDGSTNTNGEAEGEEEEAKDTFEHTNGRGLFLFKDHACITIIFESTVSMPLSTRSLFSPL